MVLLLGFILSSPLVLNGMGTLGVFLYLKIIVPILTALAVLVFYLCYPIVWYLNGLEPVIFEEEMVQEYNLSEGFVQRVSNFDIGLIGKGILYLAIILVLFYLFKKFMQYNKNKISNDGCITENYFKIEKVHKRGSSAGPGPSGTIRKIYYQFLTLLKKQGIFFYPAMTSKEIEKTAATHFQMAEASKEIREIYIKARYGKKEIPSEEVKKMKSLYNDFKKNKNTL